MKQRILNILMSRRGYVSGEKMSEELNISRAAIWKHIKNLRNDGYEIESVTNKGYHLVSAPDMLDGNKISSCLTTKFTGRQLVIFDETDSTNLQAKQHSAYPNGTAFIADRQSVGRGRLGRQWDSPKGTGIWLTILLKPEIALSDVSQITLAAGLAVCRAIGIGAKIKWPNDIVIGSKKVCGILTEMSAETDRVNYVVCGIGVNVNNESFPQELSSATSMRIEGNKKYERNIIIARILNEFEKAYTEFLNGGFTAISDEYKNHCVTLGRNVQVTFKNRTVTGTAKDITESGALTVETADGDISVNSGEVSVRGIYGYI